MWTDKVVGHWQTDRPTMHSTRGRAHAPHSNGAWCVVWCDVLFDPAREYKKTHFSFHGLCKLAPKRHHFKPPVEVWGKALESVSEALLRFGAKHWNLYQRHCWGLGQSIGICIRGTVEVWGKALESVSEALLRFGTKHWYLYQRHKSFQFRGLWTAV
jgi:hypothetical protein